VILRVGQARPQGVVPQIVFRRRPPVLGPPTILLVGGSLVPFPDPVLARALD